MQKLKKGQDITAVSKGIVNGYSSPYVDYLQVGQTHFLRVSRIGRVYLYGYYIRFEDGQRKETDWESDLKLENFVVLDGIRTDLETAYLKFRSDDAAYNKLYEDTRRDLERELHDELSRKLGAWVKDHPRPQGINLKDLQGEAAPPAQLAL